MVRHNSLVLIDGSNFYFKLKELGITSLIHFNFCAFIRHLTKKSRSTHARFYIGKIRTDGSEKSNQLQRSQQRLLRHLNNSGIQYTLGYLLKSGGVYHEKGVDVRMGVDIVMAAIGGDYQEIFVVSSDTDLIPAIENARRMKKRVIYVGFIHKISKGMISATDDHILMRKELLHLMKIPKSPTNII